VLNSRTNCAFHGYLNTRFFSRKYIFTWKCRFFRRRSSSVKRIFRIQYLGRERRYGGLRICHIKRPAKVKRFNYKP